MLKKMLEYQKVEGKCIALENELSKSKDKENASKMQQILKKQHSDLLALENSAKKINETYNSAIAKYEEYIKKLEILEKQVEEADVENAENLEKMYNDFMAVGASLEKNISKIYIEIQDINKAYEDIIKKSKTDRQKFDAYKKAYTELKNAKDPEIAKLKEQMGELEKQIDPKVFDIYKQKRESHVFPVFVPFMDKKCGGCRMEISASKVSQFKNNDLGIIECETCGRYVYQAD